MKKETKKVAKRMKEDPKPQKGSRKILKKGTKDKKKLTLKQIIKRIIGTPIIAIVFLLDLIIYEFIYKLVIKNTYNFIKKHHIITLVLVFTTIIICSSVISHRKMDNITDELNEKTIKTNKEKDELKAQLELLQTQLDELKELTNNQQEETNNRLEELNKKVTSRNAVERQTASTNTITQPTSELQEYAHNLVINEYGWTEEDFTCLVKLWNRESNWNPNAHNSSSGAHGIPQSLPASKMASEGDDYYTNGETQIRWGLKYIAGRYGDPTNAWAHSQNTGWY